MGRAIGKGPISLLTDSIVCILSTQAGANLDFLGIALDPVKNNAPARDIRAVSTTESPVAVLVVPTNEELEIAQQSYEVLQDARQNHP